MVFSQTVHTEKRPHRYKLPGHKLERYESIAADAVDSTHPGKATKGRWCWTTSTKIMTMSHPPVHQWHNQTFTWIQVFIRRHYKCTNKYCFNINDIRNNSWFASRIDRQPYFHRPLKDKSRYDINQWRIINVLHQKFMLKAIHEWYFKNLFFQ